MTLPWTLAHAGRLDCPVHDGPGETDFGQPPLQRQVVIQVKSMETVRMETRVRVRVSVCLLVSIGLPLTPHMPVRCPSHLKAPRQPPRTHMALVLAEHPAKSRRARRRNSSGNLGKSRMHAHVVTDVRSAPLLARSVTSRSHAHLTHRILEVGG